MFYFIRWMFENIIVMSFFGVPFYFLFFTYKNIFFTYQKEMIGLVAGSIDWIIKNIFSILFGVVLCIAIFIIISHLKNNKCGSCATCNKNCDFKKDD